MMANQRSRRREWDPMSDDYNDTYDAQYDDDNAEDQVQLEHTKLYIINIPQGLNEEGIRAAFSKYGRVVFVKLNTPANKRFAFVQYETASEAKLAMMKMNGVEPLNLRISIAHKTRRQVGTKLNSDNRERTNQTRNASSSKDGSSVSSKNWKPRNLDEVSNNGEVDDMLADDQETNIEFELDQLALEQLKVKEEQILCKRRLLLRHAEKKQALAHHGTTRSILPDGRIIVRNNLDTVDSSEMDTGYVAGGCESLKIPGLQRNPSRQCVKCGAPADLYCSRCSVTPYCSQRCQKRDWIDRHKDVCHNLALSKADKMKEDVESIVPQAAPLRRPHSPPRQTRNHDETEHNKSKMNHDNKQAVPKNYRTPNTSYNNMNGNRSNDQRRSARNEPKHEENENWEAKNNKPTQSPKQNEQPKQKEPINPATPITFQRRNQNANPVVKFEKAVEKPPLREQPVANRQANTTPTLVKNSPPVVKNIDKPVVEEKPVVKPKLVPDSCLIEKISIGDSVLLSVEIKTSECNTKQDGYVCLSMHENYENDYQKLCEDYVVDCESDTDDYKITIGETFSYLNPEDGGWYRARALNMTTAALIDGSKMIKLQPNDKIKKLSNKYATIPEFCCVLNASVEVGANLKCTLVTKTPTDLKVTLEDVETGANVGNGEISRWLPTIEYPAPVPAKNIAAPTIDIPEIPRPEVKNKSRVILVDATEVQRVFVRPASTAAQMAFDNVLQEVLLYGTTAEPIKEPPVKGQTVVSKFTDGLHYRALCKRTSVVKNKYLLEYVEYGNVEITQLERLYSCPESLSVTSLPSLTSHVQLDIPVAEFTPKALQYIESIKEQEMILTISTGAESSPSGSALVTLTTVKNNENVNKKIQELCTPEWKKLEMKGVDVVEMERLMYGTDLDYIELPEGPFTLQVLDDMALDTGNISGCPVNNEYVNYVMTKLPLRLKEYCESEFGRKPYLPAAEELCIAQFPNSKEWYRAVVLQQINGPGGDTARVLFVDHGNIAEIPVAALRKMLAEFIADLPAVACQITVEGFPEDITKEMLLKAREFMKTDRGQDELRVKSCTKQCVGIYSIQAPELLKAMS